MSDIPHPGPAMTPPKGGSWRHRLMASRKFQSWAARFPLTRGIVRAEGEAMFDLVAGFCHSQILQALVAFDIPQTLLDGPMDAAALARRAAVPPERMVVLLNGGAALGLIKRRGTRYSLTRRGAALSGVPGLADMIAHHAVLYRDLADPVAFFRGETETELADFWPYVFGAGAATDPDAADRYSRLMADSQVLVAEDTLNVADLSKSKRLMDVGGGTGAFLAAVASRHPGLDLTLFDLPAVAPAARARFDGLGHGLAIETGSFRDQPLPTGADTISLVRVLYDHSDATVAALLRAVHTALPAGGRLLISEPMTGAKRPERAGDAYFALYCMAMRTGRARSSTQISALLSAAGFGQIAVRASPRPFVTTVIQAVRLD